MGREGGCWGKGMGALLGSEMEQGIERDVRKELDRMNEGCESRAQ